MVTNLDLVNKYCAENDMGCGEKVLKLYDDCAKTASSDVEACVDKGMKPKPTGPNVPKSDADVPGVCGDAAKAPVNKECTDAFKNNINQCKASSKDDPDPKGATDACIDSMGGVDDATKALMNEALSNKTWRTVSLFAAQSTPPPPKSEEGVFPVLTSPTLDMCSEKEIDQAKSCREAVKQNEAVCKQNNASDQVAKKACVDGLQGVAGTDDPRSGKPNVDLMKEVMSSAGTWNGKVIRPRETDGRGMALRFSLGGAWAPTTHNFAAQVGSDCGSEDPGSCNPSKQQSNQGGAVIFDIRGYPFTFANDDLSVVADLGLGLYYSWEALNPVQTDNNKIYENYNQGLHRIAATIPDIILWPSKRFGIRAAGYFGGIHANEIYGQAEGRIKLSGTDAAVIGGMAGLIFHLHDNVALAIDAVVGKEFSTTGRKIPETINEGQEDEQSTTVNNNLSSVFFLLGFKLEFAFIHDDNLGKRPATQNAWVKGMAVSVSTEGGTGPENSNPTPPPAEQKDRAPLKSDEAGAPAPGQKQEKPADNGGADALPDGE